jgi:hypothetical protein
MARFVMARRPGCGRQPVCDVCVWVGRVIAPFGLSAPLLQLRTVWHTRQLGLRCTVLGVGKLPNAAGAHNASSHLLLQWHSARQPVMSRPAHGHEFPALGSVLILLSTQYMLGHTEAHCTAPRGCISLQPPVASRWVMPSKRNVSPVCREPRGHGQSPEYRSETSGGQTHRSVRFPVQTPYPPPTNTSLPAPERQSAFSPPRHQVRVHLGDTCTGRQCSPTVGSFRHFAASRRVFPGSDRASTAHC